MFRDYKPIFEIDYTDIPLFNSKHNIHKKKIKGHSNKIKIFQINNKNVLVFCGRRHLYQGYDFSEVTVNIKLAYELGIKNILLTNAAGGLNKKLHAGDLMLIDGFIDLMQSTERGVLSGIIEKPFKISTKLTKDLKSTNKLKSGTYAGMLGPSYETYSEINLLKHLGASAVGMSTIPEIICAKSLGMNYAAISIISNIWDEKHKPSHKEVLRNVSRANEKLNSTICKILDFV